MSRVQRFVILIAMVAGVVSGQTDVPLWYDSGLADPRIRIRSQNGEGMQELLVWSKRALSALEQAWRFTVPFEDNQPLTMVVTDEVETCRLLERVQDGGMLRQRILIPATPGPGTKKDFEETFVLAMGRRVIRDARPPEKKGDDVTLPAWLLSGFASHVRPGESARLAASLFHEGQLKDLPSPDVMSGNPDTLSEAESFLLCRWVANQLQRPGVNAAGIWARFSSPDPIPPAVWLKLSGADDLRELHIQWQLWTLSESSTLISRYRLEAQAVQRLNDLLTLPVVFIGDAQLGASSDEQTIPELTRRAHPKLLSDYLGSWIVSLEALRFRQSEEFNQLVRQYVEVTARLRRELRTRRQIPSDGFPSIDRAWNQAVEAHHAYLLSHAP